MSIAVEREQLISPTCEAGIHDSQKEICMGIRINTYTRKHEHISGMVEHISGMVEHPIKNISRNTGDDASNLHTKDPAIMDIPLQWLVHIYRWLSRTHSPNHAHLHSVIYCTTVCIRTYIAIATLPLTTSPILRSHMRIWEWDSLTTHTHGNWQCYTNYFQCIRNLRHKATQH